MFKYLCICRSCISYIQLGLNSLFSLNETNGEQQSTYCYCIRPAAFFNVSFRNTSHIVHDIVTDCTMQKVIRFVLFTSDINDGQVNNIRFITAQSVLPNGSQLLAVQLITSLDYHRNITHLNSYQ